MKTLTAHTTRLLLAAAHLAVAVPALAQTQIIDTTHVQTPTAFASLDSATQQPTPAPPTTPQPSDQNFGVGVRLGGSAWGMGGSLRYFFGGPLGVQLEVSRYGLDAGLTDFSSTQYSPAIIYRFTRKSFEAPLSLRPYVGGGVSIVRSSFDDDFFGEEFSDSSTGLLAFGGVQITFNSVPKLGLSGEFTFNGNGDIGVSSFGGPAVTVAGHWYFR